MNIRRFSIFLSVALALSVGFIPHHGFADEVKGDERRTVTALESALKSDPNNSELWLHLGFAYRKLDQLDQAVNAFEKAGSLNPHEHDSFYMLGLLYEKQHRNSDALRAWKACKQANASRCTDADTHIQHLSQ